MILDIVKGILTVIVVCAFFAGMLWAAWASIPSNRQISATYVDWLIKLKNGKCKAIAYRIKELGEDGKITYREYYDFVDECEASIAAERMKELYR